jgi:purine-binding chemotaxis protein CheW
VTRAPSTVAVPADPAAVARILADRARALAVPLRAEQPRDTVDLVVLLIGRELYGLDTAYMVEVQTLAGLARLPGLPPLWAGITNVRGTLWPVLNLARYLGLSPATRPAPGQRAGSRPAAAPPAADGVVAGRKVALVADASLSIGLLVDDAVEIRRVPTAQIGPPLAGAASTLRRQVRGVTPDLLTVLDVAGLLADPRLIVHEEPT